MLIASEFFFQVKLFFKIHISANTHFPAWLCVHFFNTFFCRIFVLLESGLCARDPAFSASKKTAAVIAVILLSDRPAGPSVYSAHQAVLN